MSSTARPLEVMKYETNTENRIPRNIIYENTKQKTVPEPKDLE
jgi:hypothetical protein